MRLQTFLVMAIVASGSAAAFAETVARQEPTEAAAPVPAVRYESAFSGYAPFREQEPGAWREQNDEIGKVGGHAGHLKGRPDPSSNPTPPGESPQPQGDHGTPDHPGRAP